MRQVNCNETSLADVIATGSERGTTDRTENDHVTKIYDAEISFCLSKIICDMLSNSGCYTEKEYKVVIGMLLEKYKPLISSFLLDC